MNPTLWNVDQKEVSTYLIILWRTEFGHCYEKNDEKRNQENKML